MDYKVIDADAHYYETPDAFTRHIETKFKDKAVMHVPGKDNIGRVYQGANRLKYAPSWPIDMMGKPGSLMDYYLGLRELSSISGDPFDPKDHPVIYRKRERLEWMAQEGVQASVMLPTLGVQVENDLRQDVPALYANFRSFNRWLQEEWGFGDDGIIFGVPMLSLVDPDEAVKELERVLKEGARTIYLRPGPVYGRSPADFIFDPFWSRVNEARIPVLFHTGDASATYIDLFSPAWGETPNIPLHKKTAFQWYSCVGDRPIMDTYAALILHNLFGRFPNVRAVSVELGCTWVEWLLERLDKAYRDSFGAPNKYGTLHAKPSEIFKQHIYISPFLEEDSAALAGVIGVDHVLFGSDYPHPEGCVTPGQFAERLEGMASGDVRKIMRENTAKLFNLAP